MKQKSIAVVVVFILCAFVASIAAAQSGTPPLPASDAPRGPDTPQGTGAYLTFQGRLTNANGAPVNTPVQATFRIYTDTNPASAATAIWTSSLRIITPTNGLFTVYLGDGSDPDLFVGPRAAAIGIQIAPDPELTPRQPLNAVIGSSGSGSGVAGISTNGFGVSGYSTNFTGVHGHSASGMGVSGDSNSSFGVYGSSSSGTGVYGYSSLSKAGAFSGGASCCDSASVRVENRGSAVGLWASTTGVNAGVFGQGGGSGVVGEVTANGGIGVVGRLGSGVTAGYAGQFLGNVQITGNLSKGGGSFKIDHPLDPANKYLYHSFVESPDMMNLYNGNVTTDANGEAVIQLPAWFEALNRDFRYQLTPIGQFAQAIVLKEMAGNQFTIKTDKPNVKVSWQVTGIRHDPYANAHRIPVEENKLADERGKYLYPDLYGQPESQSIIQQLGEQAVQATDPISKTERRP